MTSRTARFDGIVGASAIRTQSLWQPCEQRYGSRDDGCPDGLFVRDSRSDSPSRDVTSEAQAREEQHERPEFAGPDPAERTIRTFRKQRQDDQGHYREAGARSESHVVDSLHERVQPGLLDEQQGQNRDDAARDPERSDAGEDAGRQDDERGRLGRAVDVLATACDVPGHDHRDGTSVV